jgi:hypothetical protein
MIWRLAGRLKRNLKSEDVIPYHVGKLHSGDSMVLMECVVTVKLFDWNVNNSKCTACKIYMNFVFALHVYSFRLVNSD